MDQILPIIGFITIFLGGFAMYTPWIQLRHSERFTGKELIQKYPEHKWMRWGFMGMYLGWIIAMFLFFYKVLTWLNMASFLAALFASIGLFIGGFAAITGVSILPVRSPRILYVVGDDAEDAGRFQVAWSVGVIVVAMVLEILRR
jgi:hypothetical protein